MKQILDVCCGSRMFWFNKHHNYTLTSGILDSKNHRRSWDNGAPPL